MKRILICIKQKLSRRMFNSTKLIVRKCDYDTAINKIRTLGLSYNSIPIKPINMDRVAVLMHEVKSIS